MSDNVPPVTFRTDGINANLAADWRTIRGTLALLEGRIDDRAAIADILQEAGVPSAAMDDPDFPISVNQDWLLFLAFCRMMPDPVQALPELFHRVREWDYSGLGLIGLAMKYAPNLYTVTHISMEYPQLSWGRTRVQIDMENDQTRQVYSVDRNPLARFNEKDITRISQFAILIDMLASYRIVEDVTNGQVLPDRIHLALPQPVNWRVDNPDIPCPVIFNATFFGITWAGDLRHYKLPAHDRLSYRSFINALERAAPHLDQGSDLSKQVSRWLWSCTPPPDKTEVARLMNMSERSLTRKLKAEQTSYRQLLADALKEKACHQLLDRNKTIAAISWNLGYAEPHSFTLAFRNWTGQTPTAWRRDRLDPV